MLLLVPAWVQSSSLVVYMHVSRNFSSLKGKEMYLCSVRELTASQAQQNSAHPSSTAAKAGSRQGCLAGSSHSSFAVCVWGEKVKQEQSGLN